MIPTDMKPGNISDESLWDIIERCVLSKEEEEELFTYSKEKGILFSQHLSVGRDIGSTN